MTQCDRFLIERDVALARVDRAGKILMAIHALLYPPLVTAASGLTYRFKMPDGPDGPHDLLQKLSDRIRAIPDELDAARKETPK
jgi:hypothetical protein